MPLYEYKCPLCQSKHTESHGMNEKPKLTQCENCKVDLIKVLGFGAVTFNGDGFYSTDKKSKVEVNI